MPQEVKKYEIKWTHEANIKHIQHRPYGTYWHDTCGMKVIYTCE